MPNYYLIKLGVMLFTLAAAGQIVAEEPVPQPQASCIAPWSPLNPLIPPARSPCKTGPNHEVVAVYANSEGQCVPHRGEAICYQCVPYAEIATACGQVESKPGGSEADGENAAR